MARFFLPAASWQPTTHLPEEESRHCAQVLRFQTGDQIEVIDGQGRRAQAHITHVRKQEVAIELGAIEQLPRPNPALVLAAAVPKGKTMDWVIEKAVELGVARIVPLMTHHTVVKYDSSEAIKKAEKWQKQALEACKQCGQTWLPEVETPLSMSQFLATPRGGAKLIASLADGAQPLRPIMEAMDQPESVTILIGPEGDFSEQETQGAIAAGYQPVTLGPLVLRCETAALLVLSALRCHFG
jgi:16S rRNA (uracil1498-N3)-methyltransferase